MNNKMGFNWTPQTIAWYRRAEAYNHFYSFTAEQIYDNVKAVLSAIAKLKPQALKGTYMKSAAVCTTMSPGVKLDVKGFVAE